jgi:hypothetical protein
LRGVRRDLHRLLRHILHRVSSPHFDDEYLRLSGTPYVTLRQDENSRVEGEYRIGVQSGTLLGHAYSDFIDFTFGGEDEMEEAFGESEATSDGDRLTFELWNYHGDEYTFEYERQK